MNSMQRTLVAATLVALGVACLAKAWFTIHIPAREFLGIRVESTVEWSQLPMGWVIGGVLAIGAGAYLWASRRSG